MDHANEQILLFGIGKELHISLTAMVTNHGEAGRGIFRSVIVQNLSETPVHLIGFSWLGCEPAAAVALRCNQLSLGWHEVFVSLDVPFDSAETALESKLTESVQAHRRIGDTLPKQIVQVC